jgi:hypothetical protein
MNELGAGLGTTQKFYIIGPAEEKDTRISTNKNRKWTTLIKTIRAIGDAIKPFFINKRMYVFLDLIKTIVKSKATLAITHNG